MLLVELSLTIIFLSGYECCTGHYWREYTGTIPNDAVVAGQDYNGNVYIGQVFLQDKGTVACRIVPGEKEVRAAWSGAIHKKDKHIKILCGPRQNFEWVKVNYRTFLQDTAGKQLVIGGYDPDTLYIGRAFFQGETRVGKVSTYAEPHYFKFDEGDNRRRVFVYEALAYKENSGSSTVSCNPNQDIEDIFKSAQGRKK